MPAAFFIVALLRLAPAAQAAEPLPAGNDKVVTSQVTVPCSIEQVQKHLADAEVVTGLSPDVLSVDSKPAGNCQRLTVSVKGLLSPMRYITERCPTAKGYTERLVQSEDFSTQSTDWELKSVEGGTQVTLRILAMPKLPVPDAIIYSRVKASSVNTLERFAALVLNN